eukprot:s205_g1.t2
MRAMKGITWLNPLVVRFTHGEISPAFGNGGSLDQTIEKFRCNELSAENFQDVPLKVVQKDGILWSLNNRRLYVFRVAHAFGCCDVCPCDITHHDLSPDERVANRLKDALTSTTKGKLVKVRGGSQHELRQWGHPVVDHAAAKLPTIHQFMSRVLLVMGLKEELEMSCERLEKEGFKSVCSLFDLAYLSQSETPQLVLPSRIQEAIGTWLARPNPFADFAVDNHCNGGQTAKLGTSKAPTCPSLSEQSGQSTTKVGRAADWLDQGRAMTQQVKQQEYLNSFCERRELTPKARKDLLGLSRSLSISAAYDLAYSLEAVKEAEGYSHTPEEWSRYVSSRVAVRRDEGELSETEIERIELLIQAVTKEAQVSPKKIAELRSTLRSLPTLEREGVLEDNSFTKRVPSGSIRNPAAYVHSMAMGIRKRRVASLIPCFVARWKFSRHIEGELRNLCWVNPFTTERLMDPCKGPRCENSLWTAIQKERGRGYSGRSFRFTQAENHKQLESEWSSDDESPTAPEAASEAWWMSGHASATPAVNEMEQGQASQPQSSREIPPAELEEPFPDGASELSEESDIVELKLFDDLFPIPVTAPAPPRTQLAAHYVFVLDVSGSMSNRDCVRQDGSVQERIQAVKEHLSLLTRDIAEEQRKHCPDTASSDVYSAVSFNTNHYVLFALKTASAAQEELQTKTIHPKGHTYYSSGLEGIEDCVWRAEQCTETQGRRTYVLFLSDDDPMDPPEFLAKLTSLMLSRNQIQISTVAFGPNADGALCHLKQLADIGGGECKPASASAASLRRAFRAVRSTMTTSRVKDSLQASCGRLVSSSGTQASSQRDFQRVAIRDENGDWHAALFIKQNPDGRHEVEVLGHEGLRMFVKSARIWWPSPLQLESADPKNIKNAFLGSCWNGWEKKKRAWRCQYRFDGKQFQIGDVKETTVWRRVKYINKGAMRIIRFMCDERIGWETPLVCKHLLVPHCTHLEIQASTKEDLEPFCRCLAVARHFAKLWRRRAGKTLGFRKDFLYQMQDEPESTQVFMAELHMVGHYVKFNDNTGSVNTAEHRRCREIAQAFSHFSFEQSNGELLVVDIQGVPAVDEKTGDIKLHLTDPQVHCRSGNYKSFGAGDLKEEGVKAFFQTHICGDLCRELKLRTVSEYGFIPPTAVVPLPVLPEGCYKLLNAQMLRTKHRLAEVVFPKVLSEEHEVKLWCHPLRVSRAKEATQAQVFFENLLGAEFLKPPTTVCLAHELGRVYLAAVLAHATWQNIHVSAK